MKLAVTHTDFDYSCNIERVWGGFRIHLSRMVNGSLYTQTSIVTEAEVRGMVSEKELGDACNIYFEFDIETLRIGRFFNKFMQSANDKANGALFLWKNNMNVLGQIYIPFADSMVEDWYIRVNLGTGDNVYPEDAEVVENSQDGFHQFVTRVLPGLEVVAVSPNVVSDAQIDVQVTLAGEPVQKAGVRVFAKCATGYLNKREAITNENGVARFVAERLHLEPEDEMKAEFGFKFWSNLVNADIPHTTVS